MLHVIVDVVGYVTGDGLMYTVTTDDVFDTFLYWLTREVDVQFWVDDRVHEQLYEPTPRIVESFLGEDVPDEIEEPFLSNVIVEDESPVTRAQPVVDTVGQVMPDRGAIEMVGVA